MNRYVRNVLATWDGYMAVMAQITYGPIVLDTQRRELSIGDNPGLRLAPQETALLEVLMRRPNTTIGRDTLLAAVYTDPDREPADAHTALRVLVCRIRLKVARLGCPDFVVGVPGLGYRVQGLRRQVRVLTDDEARVVDEALARHSAMATV